MSPRSRKKHVLKRSRGRCFGRSFCLLLRLRTDVSHRAAVASVSSAPHPSPVRCVNPLSTLHSATSAAVRGPWVTLESSCPSAGKRLSSAEGKNSSVDFCPVYCASWSGSLQSSDRVGQELRSGGVFPPPSLSVLPLCWLELHSCVEL